MVALAKPSRLVPTIATHHETPIFHPRFVTPMLQHLPDSVIPAPTGASGPAASGAFSLDVYLWEIGQFPMCTEDDERRLGLLIRQGDKAALNELIVRNLRLVVPIARRYLRQCSGAVGLEDLINEGNIGLWRAATKFNPLRPNRTDPTRGNKFSTVATWWIRQAVDRYVVEHGPAIPVPVHTDTARRKRDRVVRMLTNTLEREPTEDEVYTALPEFTPGAWKMIALIPASAVSLDAPLDTPGGRDSLHAVECTLADVVDNGEDPLDEVVADRADEHHDAAELRRVMAEVLTPRERTVLQMRYGIGRDPNGAALTMHQPVNHLAHDLTTYEVIAQTLRTSRQRVDQLEKSGMAKLRMAASQGKLQRWAHAV